MKVQARPATLAGLIEGHARSTPDAPAIVAPGRPSLSYAALARHMDTIRRTLAAAGLGRGRRIAIALGNGPEAAVALLIAMSHATCVPLNPNGGEQALRPLCKRLRVEAILVADDTDPVVRRIAAELGVAVLTIAWRPHDPAGMFELTCHPSGGAVACTPADAEDLALVLHTSGTTRNPKAVPLTQRSERDEALRRAAWFRLTSRDRAICVIPQFTASAIRRALLPPLLVGGSVVCPPAFDAEAMLGWLEEFGPTFYAAGPAVHRAVLEAIERRGAPRHALRFVMSGSAALPADLQGRLERALDVPVIQSYAMTETGAIAQNPLPPAPRRPGSVGIVDQAEVAILDENGKSLGADRVGEIVVRGPQVFRGYEDDPEANRRAFVGDWFRTGDVGYRDPDGYLYVTGRLGEIINRGGFKVSPAEVDAVLARHPHVAEAATFAIGHPTLGEDVVAAVVLRDASRATPQELRDYALASLPDFKVPSRIVTVASIPRSPLGKVRRRELAAAFDDRLRPEHQAPRDEHEAVVAGIFAEVIGIERVGALDNFFALGGDSLRGLQVTNRANSIFGCNVSASSLFRRPTVAEFAAEIRESSRTEETFAPPPIVPLPRGTDARLDARPRAGATDDAPPDAAAAHTR